MLEFLLSKTIINTPLAEKAGARGALTHCAQCMGPIRHGAWRVGTTHARRDGVQWYHPQCWWVSAEAAREAAEVERAQATTRGHGRPQRHEGAPGPDYCGKRTYEKRTIPAAETAGEGRCKRQRTATERVGRAVYEAVAGRKRRRQEAADAERWPERRGTVDQAAGEHKS